MSNASPSLSLRFSFITKLAAVGLITASGLAAAAAMRAPASPATLASAGMNLATMAAFGSTVVADGTIVDVAKKAGSFNTLLAAAQAAGLAETLASAGPFTVFAPTDEAFAKLGKHAIADLLKPENREKLRTILLYHVVPGKVSAQQTFTLTTADTASGQRLAVSRKDGQLRIEKSTVIATDIAASNGVIHVIDRVLIPSNKTIVQTAVDAKFGTLVAAVKAAGLVEALSGPGPFTVFAPTDEAFAKLGKDMLGRLLRPENKEQLAAILKLHVVAGRVYASQIATGDVAKTLNGESVALALRDGRLSVAGVSIIKTDIDATNGVVHVIDSVLVPGTLKLKSADGSAGTGMASGNMSGVSPQGLIELAITRGVPLFNRGEEEACAAVYEITCRALLGLPGVSEEAKARIRTALGEAEAAGPADEKAWALRRGLDATSQMMGAAN